MTNSNFEQAKAFVARKRKEGHESLSGPGSHISQSKESVRVIQDAIKNLNIKSILDLGCGDWNWFKQIDLMGGTYLGWDACDTMISDNNKFYGCANIKFETTDIVTTPYPNVDLIICRDVLFHMTVSLGLEIVKKCRSACKYFVCTSFNDVTINESHKAGWGFYKINTNTIPFNLDSYLIYSEQETKNSQSGYKRYINLYAFNP